MHVLLTGAAGRIGSYTLQYLLRNGHSVTSVDVAPLHEAVRSQLSANQVQKHHVVDLASHIEVDKLFEKAGKVDGVIHFGSIPDPKGKDWRVVHNNNVAGSYNILYTAGIKYGIKRISQASSVNATGLSFTREGKQVFDEFPLTEKETYRAVSHARRLQRNLEDEANGMSQEDAYALSKQYVSPLIAPSLRVLLPRLSADG